MDHHITKLIELLEEVQNSNNTEEIVLLEKKIEEQSLLIFKEKELANLAYNYCKDKKNPIIIIEGASWTGYSFLFYLYIKKKLKHAKFIYHSHNI